MTYVIYTGGINRTLDTLDCGLYTYRVHPIYLADRDADAVISDLKKKQDAKDDFTDEDFAQLALTPLMGSLRSRKEVIKTAVLLMKPYNHLSAQKALAMTYALADKFLDGKDLTEIKEVVAMTKLGQMIYEDGVKAGESKGLEAGKREGLEAGKREGLKTGRREGLKAGKRKGLNMGIQALIETCRELGVDFDQTVQKIKSRFNMKQDAAERIVRRYWK